MKVLGIDIEQAPEGVLDTPYLHGASGWPVHVDRHSGESEANWYRRLFARAEALDSAIVINDLSDIGVEGLAAE